MSHISLDTSDNVPRRAFHEKVERIKELEAENERLTAELKAKQGLLDISNEMVSLHVETSRRSLARAEKAEAELAECRQAAFENGRETERVAG